MHKVKLHIPPKTFLILFRIALVRILHTEKRRSLNLVNSLSLRETLQFANSMPKDKFVRTRKLAIRLATQYLFETRKLSRQCCAMCLSYRFDISYSCGHSVCVGCATETCPCCAP